MLRSVLSHCCLRDKKDMINHKKPVSPTSYGYLPLQVQYKDPKGTGPPSLTWIMAIQTEMEVEQKYMMNSRCCWVCGTCGCSRETAMTVAVTASNDHSVVVTTCHRRPQVARWQAVCQQPLDSLAPQHAALQSLSPPESACNISNPITSNTRLTCHVPSCTSTLQSQLSTSRSRTLLFVLSWKLPSPVISLPSYALFTGSGSLNASNTSSSHLPTKFSQLPNLHTFTISSPLNVLTVLALHPSLLLLGFLHHHL